MAQQHFDWTRIKTMYQAGATIAGLARIHGVSKQSIHLRKNREGWMRNALMGLVEEPDALLPPLRIPGTVKYSRTRATKIIDTLARYGSVTVAAALAGITPVTLAKWRDLSEQFDDVCNQAIAAHASRHLNKIEEASARGDTQAAVQALKSNPLTAQAYGVAKDAAPPRILIQINGPTGPEPLTISGTPARTD